MWGIPQEILDTSSHERLIQSVLGLLKKPNAFLEKVEYLYENENERSQDDVELKDGSVFSRHSSPLIDSNDKYLGRIWYFRDITDQKRAEEEIRNLSRFPSENPDPVLRITRDGTVLYVNDATLDAFDKWKFEIGRPAPDELQKIALDVFSTGLREDVEVEYRDRTYSLALVPVTDADYVNVYGRDITERKQQEEMLIKMLDLELREEKIDAFDIIISVLKEYERDQRKYTEVLKKTSENLRSYVRSRDR
jgi:PAS domain-containing protein